MHSSASPRSHTHRARVHDSGRPTAFGAPAEPGTRRARRESERPRRAAPPKQSTAPRRPHPSLRHRVVARSALLAVALLAVTTSLPAVAVSTEASTTGPFVPSAAQQGVQYSEVSSTVAAGVITRDGYSVQVIPKVVPKKSSSAGLSVRSLGGRDTGQLLGQAWALPVAGFISDPFGPRLDRPVEGVGLFHEGTDLAASCGTPVVAATGGTVVFAASNGSYGNWIVIDHGNGVQTGYAHNSKMLVSVGQNVTAGETISLVGTTGASSGCHLHFETHVDGTQIDPVPFMSARGVTLG
ncbi:M23 family metallopeptidase [Cryobacterium sp. MDB1-18-2]|nr:M23 family metallopeptidase [Cryobacterium sp. MDB1-18-2]TFC38150.1 M23 family metallopeptidase [Cryobacterium sp. MDB1-18-1]